MNQEALLLPMLEPEKHILLPDTELDFSSSDIVPCPGSPQEWSSENERHYEVALYIHDHKIGKVKRVSDSHQDVFNYPFRISN